MGYSHLIAEEDPSPVLKSHKLWEEWRVVGSVKAFDAWVLDWAALKDLIKNPLEGLMDGDDLRDKLLATMWRILYMKESEKLWILERQNMDT